MSKAEERALEVYPYNGDYRGQGDNNSKFREVYLQGYHQAEKDLANTREETIKEMCEWLKQNAYTLCK